MNEMAHIEKAVQILHALRNPMLTGKPPEGLFHGMIIRPSQHHR